MLITTQHFTHHPIHPPISAVFVTQLTYM